MLVSIGIVAVMIATFGCQVARVDGMSMAPTLGDQDRLVVNMLTYELSDPRPGDIVMLTYPRDPEKFLVKRVIAAEGDTVRIADGHVSVNDRPIDDGYIPQEFRGHDNWGPQAIPPGYYFVLGDHRNRSSDSRHWGLVSKRSIRGRVAMRLWPLLSLKIF